jgi:hypothetical protein
MSQLAMQVAIMARWRLTAAGALLMLAACACAQPFTNLASGATVTTNITTLSSTGQYVKVRLIKGLYQQSYRPAVSKQTGALL